MENILKNGEFTPKEQCFQVYLVVKIHYFKEFHNFHLGTLGNDTKYCLDLKGYFLNDIDKSLAVSRFIVKYSFPSRFTKHIKEMRLMNCIVLLISTFDQSHFFYVLCKSARERILYNETADCKTFINVI